MSEILGVLFAAFAMVMFIPKFIELQEESTEKIRNVATAKQQSKIYAAATKYIKNNPAALQAIATATTPATITVAMLQDPAVNLLDSSFSPQNPYGQSWVVQVLRPRSDTLQALVTAIGGKTLKDKQAMSIATYMGVDGGFIPFNDSGMYAGGSSTIYGAFSGPQGSTAGYQSISGGRPAALLTIVDGQLVSNYLYRNGVPGQPQLNQMNTTLGMTGNNISDAGVVTSKQIKANQSGEIGAAGNDYYDIQGGRIASGNSIYSYGKICTGAANGDCSGSGGVVLSATGDVNAAGETTTGGWFRTNGDTGWYSNKWNGGFYMSDSNWVRSYNDKNMYTGGEMQAGALQSNSTLRVTGNAVVGSQIVQGTQTVGGNQTVIGSTSVTNALVPGQIATNGASCVGNQGAIARDANNNLYICN